MNGTLRHVVTSLFARGMSPARGTAEKRHEASSHLFDLRPAIEPRPV